MTVSKGRGNFMRAYYVNENDIEIFKDTESNALYQIMVDGNYIGEAVDFDDAVDFALSTKQS